MRQSHRYHKKLGWYLDFYGSGSGAKYTTRIPLNKLGPVTHEHMGLWSLRFQATVVRFPPQHFQNVQFNVGKIFVEIHRLTVHLRTELLHLNDLHLICVESLKER